MFKKFLGKHQARPSALPAADSVEAIVLQIQEGDLRLRNQFITDYQPFVAKVTSRFCKRYVDPERDDEFSIALSAFNEALGKFSPDSGASFLGFSETVIRRRLIDYVRKEQRHASQIPYSSFETEDEEDHLFNPVEVHQSIEQYERERTASERAEEIAELDRELAGYGIAFLDLVEASPKHADSRLLLRQIAEALSNDDSLLQSLKTKRALPIKELMEHADVQVSRKTLERNRKYIIALDLIISGPYPYLQDYLTGRELDEGKE